jgi:hypothetical protein
MNNKIDKFFKNKVESASVEPSTNASAKFDALLKQKNKKPLFAWWQIAASVALLLASIVYLVILDSNESSNNMADAPVIQSQPEIMDKPVATIESQVNDIETTDRDLPKEIIENKIVDATPTELAASTTQESKKANVQKTIAPYNTPLQPKEIQQKTMIASTPTVNEAEDLVDLQKKEIEVIESILVATNEENSNKKKKIVPITITYTPTPSSTLVANNETEEEAEDEKKEEKPTFKSILIAASNVALMAEIRGAKDDLINSTFSSKNKKVNN